MVIAIEKREGRVKSGGGMIPSSAPLRSSGETAPKVIHGCGKRRPSLIQQVACGWE